MVSNQVRFSKGLVCLVGRKKGSSYFKHMECFLSFILRESSAFAMLP